MIGLQAHVLVGHLVNSIAATRGSHGETEAGDSHTEYDIPDASSF